MRFSRPQAAEGVQAPRLERLIAGREGSIELLESLPCDIFLAAHASFFELDEKRARLDAGAETNPFIDPAGYRAYLARAKQRLTDHPD